MDDKDDTITSEAKLEIDAHRTIVLWLFMSTLLLSLVVGVVLLIAYESDRPFLNILPLVIAAGILGAFVSALKRIYSAADVFPMGRYRELLKGVNAYLIAYASIPPLVGAISATILHDIFAAQLIEGPLFPEFCCKMTANDDSNVECTNLTQFLQNWGPCSAVDYGKAIAWGFVAGFSERFVPDILNRVSESATKEGK